MNASSSAAVRSRRRAILVTYLWGSLMIAGSFAGVAIVLALFN